MTLENSLNIGLISGPYIPITLPARSQLFALAPVESPADQREGLISLLVRISRAHSVNPRRLTKEILSAAQPGIKNLAYSTFYDRLAATINGHGKYAALFAGAFEHLTMQQGITRLTLLPWKELFPHNGQGALARHPRWCSACLLEQRRTREDVYFPLAWSLDAYRICTLHDQRMDDQCPHCGKLQPFVPRYPDQAICHYCLRSLIRNSRHGASRSSMSDFESWVARAVGDMVAKQDASEFVPTAAKFREGVQTLVGHFSEGNRAGFCRSIGFSEHALKNWMSKKERPSMTQFLALAYAVQIPPDVLATGNFDAIRMDRKVLLQSDKLLVRQGRSTPGADDIRGKLKQAVVADAPVPVSEIARELNVSAQYLRYWFPEACRKLSQRYREYISRGRTERFQRKSRRIVEIVQELRERNRYPSCRQVNSALRRESASLADRNLFEAYKTAIT